MTHHRRDFIIGLRVFDEAAKNPNLPPGSTKAFISRLSKTTNPQSLARAGKRRHFLADVLQPPLMGLQCLVRRRHQRREILRHANAADQELLPRARFRDAAFTGLNLGAPRSRVRGEAGRPHSAGRDRPGQRQALSQSRSPITIALVVCRRTSSRRRPEPIERRRSKRCGTRIFWIAGNSAPSQNTNET